MKKIFICLYLILSMQNLFAGFEAIELSVGTGSVATSFAEDATTTESTDTTEASTPYAGAITSMPLTLIAEYAWSPKYSAFLMGILPLMTNSTERYYFVGAGINFYFKSISGKNKTENLEMTVEINPKWRYYYGLIVGGGYLAYKTTTKKKTDALFEVGAHAGVIYNFNDKYAIRLEPGFTKGTGVNTTGTSLNIFLGLTYSLY